MAASNNANYSEFLNEKFSKAQNLLSNASETAGTLFRTGDFSDYIKLSGRFTEHNFQNILLLCDQFPNATFIAAFNVWKSFIPDPDRNQILRNEAKGHPIELIAPFTFLNQKIIWFSVNMYDISQTNVDPDKIPQGKYIQGPRHKEYLVDALKLVIGTDFSRSILLTPSYNDYGGLPGIIDDHYVKIRTNSSIEDLLPWLTEIACKLKLQNIKMLENLRIQTSRFILHILFEAWGLSSHSLPPIDYSPLLDLSEPKRMSYLGTIQRTVRYLDEAVYCAYCGLRNQKDLSRDAEAYDDAGLNI